MSESPKTSPWYLIWLHPKRAMRHILDHYPTRYNHLLVICGAFTHIVTYTINLNSWWLTAVVWVCMSIFAGLFVLYVGGGLLKWTGGWLKGQGSHQDIRAAIAWAQIPIIVFFIIGMLIFWIVGGNWSSPVYATIFFIFSLWASIIFLCCLAEAHKFSFFKALMNYIIAAVIVLAVTIIVMVIVTAFSSGDTLQTTGQT